jgi:capsid assembly protease
MTSTVARNRGLTERAIRDTQAGLFKGQDAVKAKLADEILSMGEVLEKFSQRIINGPGTTAAAS